MKFKVDFKDFEKFADKVQKLTGQDIDKLSQQFCEEATKELGARFLGKAVKETPVGEYGTKKVSFVTKDGKEVNFTASSNKTGGTLKRGWTNGDEVDPVEFVHNKTRVEQKGNEYLLTLMNRVHYASYVEYGHRTRDHKGFVEGKKMMTKAIDQLNEEADSILEKKMRKFLEEHIDGNT